MALFCSPPPREGRLAWRIASKKIIEHFSAILSKLRWPVNLAFDRRIR
jgi:hypothetical protein